MSSNSMQIQGRVRRNWSPSSKMRSLRDEFLLREVSSFNRAIEQACESPIEELFLAAALVEGWHHPEYIEFHNIFKTIRDRDDLGNFGKIMVCDCSFRWLAQQLEVKTTHGEFRIDFAVFGFHGVQVAVELDGHDFHERTKEQSRRDKSRDRALTSAGWHVLRFTGSEVYEDPIARFQEAIECVGALEDKTDRPGKVK